MTPAQTMDSVCTMSISVAIWHPVSDYIQTGTANEETTRSMHRYISMSKQHVRVSPQRKPRGCFLLKVKFHCPKDRLPINLCDRSTKTTKQKCGEMDGTDLTRTRRAHQRLSPGKGFDLSPSHANTVRGSPRYSQDSSSSQRPRSSLGTGPRASFAPGIYLRTHNMAFEDAKSVSGGS